METHLARKTGTTEPALPIIPLPQPEVPQVVRKPGYTPRPPFQKAAAKAETPALDPKFVPLRDAIVAMYKAHEANDKLGYIVAMADAAKGAILAADGDLSKLDGTVGDGALLLPNEFFAALPNDLINIFFHKGMDALSEACKEKFAVG